MSNIGFTLLLSLVVLINKVTKNNGKEMKQQRVNYILTIIEKVLEIVYYFLRICFSCCE